MNLFHDEKRVLVFLTATALKRIDLIPYYFELYFEIANLISVALIIWVVSNLLI